MESDHSEYSPPRVLPEKRPVSGDEQPPPHQSSTSGKKARQRKRSKTACGECRARKQACDMKTPCNRCIKRSVVCSLQGSGSTVLAGPSTSDISAAITAIATTGAALETMLRATLDSVPRRGSLIDIESAAAVLGALARSDGVEALQELIHPGASWGRTLPDSTALVSPRSAALGEALGGFAVLPSRRVCDLLLVAYFNYTAFSLLSFTRQSTIRDGMCTLLDSLLTNANAVPAISLSFLSLISITLASALRILPEASIQIVQQQGEQQGDWVDLERVLVRQAKDALDKSEEVESPNIYRIEAMLLYGRWMKESGKPSVQYNILARAIRSAQAMGLHREGSDAKDFAPEQIQVHRRLWWNLYVLDRSLSYGFNMPYLIHDGSHSVPRPQIGMSPDAMVSSTKRNFEIELAIIIGQVMDRILSARSCTYQDVLDSETQLVDFDKSLPLPSCQLDYAAKDQARYIPTEHRLLLLQITWTRSLLHRGYLLPTIPPPGAEDTYAKSRSLAISSSQSIINQVRALYDPLSQRVPFHLFYKCFDAAANLAFAILQDPTSPRNESLDAWIREARSILVRMGSDHVVAQEAVACIDALRQKIVDCARAMNGLSTPTTTPYMGDTPLFVDSNRVPTSAAVSCEQRGPSWMMERGRAGGLKSPFVHAELASKWPLGMDALERVNAVAKWRDALSNLSIR